MWFLKKTIAVHNGSYHADDVFACATLSLFLKGNMRVIRTRDQKEIGKADFVIDVGGIYNAKTNHFDHHQIGGAGVRINGIPYASFGLVWKKYGALVCGGNEEVAGMIEQRLAFPIDAIDNGMSCIKESSIFPYTINDVLSSIEAPDTATGKEQYKAFMNAVSLAQEILSGEIRKATSFITKKKMILSILEVTIDKNILVLDEYVSRYDLNSVLLEKPEVLFVVLPKSGESGGWRVETIKDSMNDFSPRKKLPEDWAGARETDLEQITGIKDVVFCHNGRFLCVTKTKESAMQIARKALEQ